MTKDSHLYFHTGYKNLKIFCFSNYRNSELEKLIEASDILKECKNANYKEEKEIVIKRLKYIIDNMDKIFEFDSDSLDMESAILSALLYCKYIWCNIVSCHATIFSK